MKSAPKELISFMISLILHSGGTTMKAAKLKSNYSA